MENIKRIILIILVFFLSKLEAEPIIAPILRNIPDPYDHYSNFFYDVQENGYYAHDSQYNYILDRAYLGTFEVPVVHCTYLIEAAVLDQLNYIDGTNDYEFIIFSRIARKNGIRQYICNEEEFGVMVHFCHDVKGVEEKERLKWILKLPPL